MKNQELVNALANFIFEALKADKSFVLENGKTYDLSCYFKYDTANPDLIEIKKLNVRKKIRKNLND
jgi:hypothetical protein